MPERDGSKEVCFKLWLQGKSTKEIIRRTTAQKRSIQGWVKDWERGRKKKWDVS